ncbi:ATP-binding protein, partial [Enterococcus faecalis]
LPILQMALKIANAIENEEIDILWLKCYLALQLYRNQQTDVVGKRTKIISILEGTDIDTSKYHSQYGNLKEEDEKKFIEDLEKHLSSKSNDLSIIEILESANYNIPSF